MHSNGKHLKTNTGKTNVGAVFLVCKNTGVLLSFKLEYEEYSG